MKNKFKLFGGATLPMFTNKDLDVREINFSEVISLSYRGREVKFFFREGSDVDVALWSITETASPCTLQGLTETFQRLLSKGEILLYDPLHKQSVVLLEELMRYENIINNLFEKRFNESLSNQGLAFKLKEIEKFGDEDY